MQYLQNKEKHYVGIKETILYGIANGGQVMGYNLVRGQLTFYFVSVFGIPSEAVTAMIFFMGLWDAFNDPLMGSIVDRTRTRYGKLRPYLIFVPIPLAIVTVLLFGGADFLSGVESIGLKIAYMYIVYFLWEFFYTIGDIPFWGLSAAISPLPSDRSAAITSARLISSILGGIVNSMIPIFIDLSTRGIIPWNMKEVFLFMGFLAGVLGTVLMSFSGLFTKERVVQSSHEPSIFACFKYLFKNKPLLLIVASNILATVEGISGTFSQYFYILSLGMASLTLIAGIPGTVTGFFSYLFIPALEKRFSSKKIVVGCSLFNTALAVLVFLIGSRFYTKPLVIVPLLAIQGIFTSAIGSIKMVVPTKMIGDTVDYMEWKTGERNEGMSFSLLTFISKLTGSLSTALATAIMPLVHLDKIDINKIHIDSSATVLVDNEVKFWLWALMTAIPPLLGLISLIPYAFYHLEGKKLEQIREEMRIHREMRTKSAAAAAGGQQDGGMKDGE